MCGFTMSAVVCGFTMSAVVCMVLLCHSYILVPVRLTECRTVLNLIGKISGTAGSIFISGVFTDFKTFCFGMLMRH